MITAFLRLMRLYYTLPMAGGWVVIVLYRTGDRIHSLPSPLVPAFLSLFCVISAAYVLNDVFDVPVDTINCPRRMLPSRQVSRQVATLWSMILLLLGLLLAWFSGLPFFIGIILLTLGLVFYDIFSKRLGFFKDLLVAALMTSLYPLAAAFAEAAPGPRIQTLYIHPFWLFFTALGYEMLKDVRDLPGDEKVQSLNSIAHWSRKSWFLPAARLLIVTAALITPLPYFLGSCKYLYLAASLTAILLTLLSLRKPPAAAIRYIYAEVFLITLASLADLLWLGP